MKCFRYCLLSVILAVSLAAANREARGAGFYFSDGKYPPGNGQAPVRNIHWEEWRADTFGCMGKRWTYLDSIDRSAIIGTPKDTILKYMGAPGRISKYETDTRFLLLFRKKYAIAYHLYPITSNCATREPWVAVRIYYDRHGNVLGVSRQYP